MIRFKKAKGGEMKKSFTLIELMVVIAIIGILGVVITPVVGKAIQKANAAKIIAVGATLETACEMYYMDTSQYAREYTWNVNSDYKKPTWSRLSMDPGVSGWDGPYIKFPLTPSQNPYKSTIYVYSTIATHAALSPGEFGFDLDGDGTSEIAARDANWVVFFAIPQTVAQRVNDTLDGPGGSWQGQGRVEYLADASERLSLYLTGGYD
jgi:prepilin-type N-terminal cleavage/methylation domain-containing protein